jgi:hypothetical protein
VKDSEVNNVQIFERSLNFSNFCILFTFTIPPLIACYSLFVLFSSVIIYLFLFVFVDFSLLTSRELTEEEFKEKIIAGYVAVVLLNSLRFACLECQRNLYHSHDNVYHLSDIPTHLDESVGPPYRGTSLV